MPVIGCHKASQNADFFATHNLEVPGSSPGWSTQRERVRLFIGLTLFFFCLQAAHAAGCAQAGGYGR